MSVASYRSLTAKQAGSMGDSASPNSEDLPEICHTCGGSLPSHEKYELFEKTLQRFAREVGIICALEHGQKIPSKDAYYQIKALFKELKLTKRSAYPRKAMALNEDSSLPAKKA